MRRAKHNRESGFAMLFVFVLAAAVSIVLYRELPRVVFESQRSREETLIDRGEQYKRAIQLYVRKFKKYPSSLDDLETTNNIRFLRRRYKDPMTGKDEWRMIHIDAAGVISDSKVQKNPLQQGQQPQTAANAFIGETQLVASAMPAGSELNPALAGLLRQQRPSDRPAVDANTPIGQPTGDPNAPPLDPQATQQYPPPVAGQPTTIVPGQPYQFPQQQPGQPFPFPQAAPGQSQFQPQPAPIYPQAGQQPFFPNQSLPDPASRTAQFQQRAIGGGAYPTTPVNSQAGGVFPAPAIAGVNLQANNAALDLIQRALTQPRPGGLAGVPSQSSTQSMGAGLVGVASKFEGETIKVYHEREKFEEWEFIYDLKNDRAALGGAGGLGVQQGQQGQGQRPGQGQGQSPFGQLGPNPPFGGQRFPPGGQPGISPGSPLGPPPPPTMGRPRQ